MSILKLEAVREEQGFTLVELAVVMVIIGLLIGGILKGQEMIANQQVNSTIAQIKAVDGATSTFRDIYAALPGDMSDATTRVPGCTGPCNDGNGDGVLANLPNATSNEAYGLYKHLAGADLLSGVSVTAANNITDGLLQGQINGTYLNVGYVNVAAVGVNADAPSGHYIYITPQAIAGDTALTPNEAARIDRKLDDGEADTGSVFGSVAACHTAGTYNEATERKNCDLYIRINS